MKFKDIKEKAQDFWYQNEAYIKGFTVIAVTGIGCWAYGFLTGATVMNQYIGKTVMDRDPDTYVKMYNALNSAAKK